MSIFDWSKTAASNGNSDAAINFQEGQAPSTVNDSARSLMARIAYWRDWFSGNFTQSGSSNAYTMTSGESLSAYTAGMRFLWKPNADSTGAVTLNLDSIGAKKVYLPVGTQAGSGDIDADAVYDVVYQTTLDSSNGGFKIVGPSLDADLTTLAGLTVAADNFIVGNSGGTAWEVKTPANARTSLGLGTSATVNTGTSGATIPLLNGVNTWASAQTYSADIVWGSNIAGTSTGFAGSIGANPVASITSGGYVQLWGSTSANPGRAVIGNASQTLVLDGSTAFTYNGSGIWHAGNDGAGSGLDADTLDGVQGSDYATLTGTQTLTNKTLTSPTVNSGALSGTFTGAPTFSGGVTLTSPTINGGTIQSRPQASSETSGTLTSASANKTIQLAGDVTINNSVFSAGDIIVMYAGASARTITAGTITTMRLDGTSTTGSRTLAARGIAVLFFVSASEVVVAGGAVT
jgi:hypothetical protein